MADEAVDGGDPNDDGEAANDATAGAEGTNAANTNQRSSNQDPGVVGSASVPNQTRMRTYGIPPSYVDTYARAKGITVDQAVQEVVNARHEHNPTAEQTAMNAQLDKSFAQANPGIAGLMDVAATAFGAIPGFGAITAIGNLVNKSNNQPTVGFGISDLFGTSKNTSQPPGVTERARASLTERARSGVQSVSNAVSEVDKSIADALGTSGSTTSNEAKGDPGGKATSTDHEIDRNSIVAQGSNGLPVIRSPLLSNATSSAYDDVLNTWRRILGDTAFGGNTARRTV